MQTVTDAYTQENLHNGNYNIIDTAISYDGTGQKRGHKSNFDAAAVLDLQVSFLLLLLRMSIYRNCTNSACCKCFEENNNSSL